MSDQSQDQSQDHPQDQPQDQPQAESDPDHRGKGPDYIAYNIREGSHGNAYWNRVGVAYEHRDGKGLNIELNAVPVDGKLTLREQADQALAGRERAQGPAAERQATQNHPQTQGVDHGRER